MHAIHGTFTRQSAIHHSFLRLGRPVDHGDHHRQWPACQGYQKSCSSSTIYPGDLRPILDAFWADGICIDQSNLKERGHQVALMGQLYRKATLVCSWMGRDKYGCCKPLENLQNLGCIWNSGPRSEVEALEN